MSRPGQDPRASAALLLAGLTLVLSYTAQRLYAWTISVPSPPTEILAAAHIPYFWRVGLSVLHAVLVGALAHGLLEPSRAVAVVDRGPWLVLLTVLPCAVAMVVVP